MSHFPRYPSARTLWIALAVSSTAFGSSAAEIDSTRRQEDYRRHALTRTGNATNGARLFADEQRLGCSKCHSVDGRANKAGPDLAAVGDAFARRDLIESVLTPSATISPGYGTVVVETKSGEAIQGILKQSNASGIELMGGDGVLVHIAPNDIARQEGSATSLMPEGLQNALSPEEFTDLVDYLATLRQPANLLASNRGMPDQIPPLARPIRMRPFLDEPLVLPPGKVRTCLTAIQQVPGSAGDFLVLHQKGLIWRVRKSATGEQRSVFSDLRSEVFSDRGPNGLLGMTFHPKFQENRKYYLQLQVFEDGSVATLVLEKEFSADFSGDSGKPARRIIKTVSVAEDHSGGWLEFGPDGYLYFAMGDTGPHQDPNGHAQNLRLLLGKMMRLDVDHPDGTREYSIPADNPFLGQPDARPEIWAYGFRNPWRFSFDPENGDLWLADVGQDRVEEVALVHRGENHGWNVFEGFEPFSNQFRVADRDFVPPVFAYRRKYGNSVTGGYVYRGDRRSSFYGVYVCGDFTSKRIFGVRQSGGVLTAVHQIGTCPQQLVSFGKDNDGNLYAIGYDGMIFRLDFSGSDFGELAPN